jgi:hypothetical protein
MLTGTAVADRPAAGNRPWLAAVCWTATLALVLVFVRLLWRFAVDWPLHDDLTQILAIPGYLVQLDARRQVALLFELSPEHRIATLRIAGWVFAQLPGGLDFRWLIALGNAMLLATGAYVVGWAPRALRAAIAVLAALLLTSVTHYGAQYWATGALQHFGASFYALTALALLAGGRPRHGFAAAFALLAAFTSANGLLVFAAAALLLALSGRRGAAAAWLGAGVVLCLVYFIGYETPPGRPGILRLVGDDPAALASFVLATCGAIAHAFGPSLILGALVVAAWIAMVATGAWRRLPPALAGAALFGALSCAMIAVGRANLGVEAVGLSRYRVYSALLVLATIVAVAWITPRSRAPWLVGGSMAGAALFYVLALPVFMTYIVELSMSQRALRDHFAATGHARYGGYRDEFGDFTLHRAEEIGAYRGARKATSPRSFTPGMPDRGVLSDALQFDVLETARIFSVSGWMAGAHRDVDVWLEGGGRAYRARIGSSRFWRGPTRAPGTGFHGTLRTEALVPGRYRLGFGDGAVAWTQREIVVE